jgi:hypothetical protein
MSSLEPKGNRKAKRTVKESLRVLILDLYVKWLKEPSISIGFSKGREAYTVGSRYNGLFVPRKVVNVEELLVEAGYIEELKPFHNDDQKSELHDKDQAHGETEGAIR